MGRDFTRKKDVQFDFYVEGTNILVYVANCRGREKSPSFSRQNDRFVFSKNGHWDNAIGMQ